MKITIEPVTRRFDNRIVYCWGIVDESNRLRDSGCELSRDAAERAARRSHHAQGPDLLLDMLECRRT